MELRNVLRIIHAKGLSLCKGGQTTLSTDQFIGSTVNIRRV
jgi:hypothetical protein